MADNEESNSTGTARLLHELSEYEKLERDYPESDVAIALTTKAIQRVSKKISREDVISTVKVCRILLTGQVDIAHERQQAEKQAEAATEQLLRIASEPEKEEIDS